MELVEGERILWQGRPSWRAQISFFIVWIPLALLPVIIAGILEANDQDTGLPYYQWLLISLILVICVVVYDALRRYSTFYLVTDQRLRVRKGILSRHEQSARFERVQNVELSQSFMDRLLKVGAVEFDTAGSDHATFTESGSSNGLGDLSIRAKYNFLRGDVTALAAGLDLRLPTGDKDELLGTGATRAEMTFIYSGDYGRVSPHVNVGYTLSSGTSSSSASDLEVDPVEHRLDTIGTLALADVDLEVPDEFNYVFGLNVAAHPRVTVGFDVRGRTLFDVSRFELRDNVYPNRAAGPVPTAAFTASQEFSLLDETGKVNMVLGIVGAKINVAKTLLLNANVLFPMTDGGLKPKPTLVFGIDYVF